MADKKHLDKRSSPVNETKEERFLRVATPRVVRAIKYIKLLGNCASSAYAYTPEQVKKMTDAIEDALVGTAEKFAIRVKEESEFEF